MGRDRQIDRSNILGNIPSKFGKMDIANKTRFYRSSKRFDLFSGQWEAKRLENHRKKVENAGPRIDVQTPKSANFQHVKVKAKKLQKEEERSYEILSNNLILLRHLTKIASSKRVPDDMKPKEKKNLYEQILLFRRSQLRNMIDEENEALEEKEDQLRFFVNSEERELAKKK